MKKILTSLVLVSFVMLGFAQNKPYNPDADAKADLKKAIIEAKQDGKHVLAVVGGNWCSWCVLLDKYIKGNDKVKGFIDEKFVFVKVSYSKEKKNMPVMKELEFPQRFGFPVLVVLDENGERIHTQNSGYLEEGRGYNEKKVMGFLKAWTKEALAPELYMK